jgi:hypothetical protein
MMNKLIAFGVGCFHFGLKKINLPSMSGQDYVRELILAIESIPNVKKVDVIAPDEFKEETIEALESLTSLKEGNNFFPYPSCSLDIDFEIYIPTRLQNELSTDLYISSLPTERFIVHIRDSYHFPVTFIELVNANKDCDPSGSIVIVREFLEKHFTEAKSDYIRFDFLGPSPFYANFFLYGENIERVEEDFDSDGFSVEQIPQKGYDTFDIHFDKSLYTNLNEAKEAIFYELSDEIGLFYKLEHHNLLQMRQWENLQELVSSLIGTTKGKGLKAFFSRLLHSNTQIRDAIIMLSEFESNHIWTTFILKSDYQDLFNSGKEPYTNSYITKIIQNFPTYPTNQVRDVISLLENRRSKTVDNLVIILAAILGGIVGAIFTLLIISR